MNNYLDILPRVKAFIFDVDGVLTDGVVTLMPDGEQVRHMNIKDGYALQLAVKKGYKTGIISGGTSEPAKIRLQKLGIKDLYFGVSDKLEKFEEFCIIHDLSPKEILYMGDDIPDYEVMAQCGLPCCPADAASEIKKISLYISDKKGGEGCVRDVIEKVMKAQNNWFDISHSEEFAQFKW
ncbi:MAG: HAD-IIIA family hydrolase [Bacteroidetes bacterium]|nr:MAG: HAD-IIIA family hydrolase [Bacteroidota bacterium]